MLQGGHHLAINDKAPSYRPVLHQAGADHPDGDLSVGLVMMRQIDISGAAFTDEPVDSIFSDLCLRGELFFWFFWGHV